MRKIGLLDDEDSQSVVNNITQDDSIEEVQIEGQLDIDDELQEMIDGWNQTLSSIML